MQSVNWVELFEQKRVPYVTRGPNVSRGEINIQCPFCGSADPSHHLGINLESGYWSCWRNALHRGKSPLRLLMRALSISYDEARQVAGLDVDADPTAFATLSSRLQRTASQTAELKTTTLGFPEQFRPIRINSRSWRYLLSRGFPPQDANSLIIRYHLMEAFDGPFKDRIIIPYYYNNHLLTWSGRAIANSVVRYKTLSREESVTVATETFYNRDVLDAPCKVLLVVEGAFDVMKLDFYGAQFGVRAIAMSTSTISEVQSYILETAAIDSGNIERIIVMRDTAAELDVIQSMQLRDRISFIPSVEFMAVPYGYKDGGELPPEAVVGFARKLINN